VVKKSTAQSAPAKPSPAKAAPPVAKPLPAPAKVLKPAETAPKTAPQPVAVVEAAPLAIKAPSLPLPAPGPTKSGALFYDSHMHTPLCKHAWGEPEEYAQQAVKAGLKGIIFTCHCPMPDGFWPSVRMSETEFDTYVAIVQRAANAFKGKLDIRLGIESEYYPGCEEYIAKLHQRADFHYILGAVHWQAKEYLNKYETGTIENFRRTYFDHLAKSAESGLYDCLAHPDLVKNYHPDSWCFAIVKNTVSTVLDRIAATGVAMELNSSGLNKSYSEMNPGLEMLRMMADRKIPVVLGSDSHRPVRVGEHFVTALNHLTEAGYEKVSHFLNRQRIDLNISEVLASLKKAADHNA
jgi:histidinol-phosphatase (PHP family)